MTATRAILMAAAILGGFASVPAAAQANVAPWCAVLSMGRGDAYWDCRYASLQACQPNVLGGNRGFCNPNPRWVAPVAHHKRKS